MNFNTDTQITFLKILEATGNKKKKRKEKGEKRFILHACEDRLVLNTSAGPGWDKTGLNYSSN